MRRKKYVSLEEHIAANIRVDPETDCHVWTGTLSRDGYARMGISGRTREVARVIFELVKEPLGPGQEPDHLCRNRACVNPDHLEAVTHAENIRRGANTKLSPEQIADIQQDSRGNGVIAREYGISATHVWRIKKGKV